MTTGELESVIDQGKLLGVLSVIFSAGEPLLREDIVELVRYAHDAGLLTQINTNGLLLDRKRVSRLKEAGLTQCCVSIDDADPDVHDRLRGIKGSCEKALEGIRILREFDIPCQIFTYAAKRNVVSGLQKIIDMGKQLGVMSVYIFFPVAAGHWEHAFDQVLTEEEKATVRELQDLTFVHLELPTPRSLCCVFAKSVLYVSPTGNVTPCPFVPHIIGNVKDHTLHDLWQCHTAKLDLEYRGDCPLNNPRSREALKRHVDSVARTLR